MSMFLIETDKLNNNLIDICEKMIHKILKAIENYVFQEESGRIKSQIQDINTAFAKTVQEVHQTKELVDYENYHETVKTETEKQILDQYKDLIEWLMLLYKYPQLRPTEESFKQINTCFNQVEKIFESINSREESLKNQRDNIINLLDQKIRNFRD